MGYCFNCDKCDNNTKAFCLYYRALFLGHFVIENTYLLATVRDDVYYCKAMQILIYKNACTNSLIQSSI